MIAVDSTTLLLFLSPIAAPPRDPITNQPIPFAKERVEYLVRSVEQRKTKVIIPAPVLSEVLVHVGSALDRYMDILTKRTVFRIIPFDVRAAIELAIMTKAALDSGDKRGGVDAPWTKIKFDRQIVSIVKAYGVSEVYSDDFGVKKFGEAAGLTVTGLLSCPLPPEMRQGTLGLHGSSDDEAKSAGGPG